MKKSVLVLLALLFSFPAYAVTPFVISDIEVEGLERLDAGTIFNYLPLKVGDEMNDEEGKLAIKALFETGFFRDVQLGQDGTVLVVTVVERPSIASVTITGNKEIETESLEQGLREAELLEGRIFNRASLDVVEREIQQAYLSMGRYSTRVETSVEELERNRVAVEVKIDEGRVAKIKKINIVGAEQISAKELKDELNLLERKGWRLFTKRNQYSRQKLEADVERIRSYYLDRGFHDFEILSTNVDISPNKQNIFISIALEEGERYVFGETMIEVADEIEGLDGLVTIEPGKAFSRKVVNQTRSAISDKYADNGYAFVEVRPDFEVDQENRVVSTVFTIDPKQRVYVRKIEISGNTYTRDEIIRREIRQFEGSWYSAAAVQRSRERLNRLGFFDSVIIETPNVPGTTDQVDLKVVVVERETGSIQLSVGYSDADGPLIGANYEQRNFLGSGRELRVDINTSDAAEVASIEYINPYYTADGVSRGFNFTRRKIDSAEVDTASYLADTTNLGMRFKIPIAESNSFNVGIAYERLELAATDETPPEFLPIILLQPDSDQFPLTIGVSKDTRDDFFFPTGGGVASLGGEITVPGSDFEYYKINLQGAYYVPVSSFLTFKAGAGVGYGDAYGDLSEFGLPFFKNYFAGGSKSVRGYRARSLGPRDSGETPDPIGGSKRLLINAEVWLPAYGDGVSKDKRLGLFFDGGQVWSTEQDFEFEDLRYSAGIVFNWFSPLGPFSLSYGEPLNDEEFDDIENFQISFGTVFR